MKARLIMVGPPGAGKGTQAVSLTHTMEIPNISTGAIFRSNMAQGTDLGEQARAFMESGNLVPDEITDAMVRARLGESDASEGFLLDGYPRNAHQVDELDSILESFGTHLDAVVEITIPDEQIVDRLLNRAKLEGRSDDTEDVIRHRINVYHEQTAPVVDLYHKRGILLTIDGTGTIDEVHERIIAALRSFLNA